MYKSEMVRVLAETLDDVKPSKTSPHGAVWAVFKPVLPALLEWLDAQESAERRRALAEGARRIAAAWERENAPTT